MQYFLVAFLAFNHGPVDDDDRGFRNSGGVAISADGSLIVYGRDRDAFMWDRQDNKVRRLMLGAEGDVAACRINGPSNLIAVSVSKYRLGGGPLLLFDRSAKQVQTHTSQIYSRTEQIGFLSAPERVYLGVEAWNRATGERTNLLSKLRQPRASSAKIHPMPKGYLVTGQRIPGEGPLGPIPAGMFVSYAFEDYATEYSLAGIQRKEWLSETLQSAEFVSPVGTNDLLAIGYKSACVISVDGTEKKCFEVKEGEHVRPLRYRGWVLVTNGKRVSLTDALTGKVIAELASTRENYIVDAAVSPTANIIVTLRHTGLVQLWNAKSGQEIDHRAIRAGTKIRN